MSIFSRPNAPPKSMSRRHSGIVVNPWPVAVKLPEINAPKASGKPGRDWTNVRLRLLLVGFLAWAVTAAVLFGMGGR